jgi:DNA repair exonuclease SbcCD ATPase subunit
LAGPAWSADLEALERALRDASRERARLVEERARKMGDAAVLADEISRQKTEAASRARADRRLEAALKRFDHLAQGLDAADRRIAAQDQAIAALRRKFEDAAGSEAARWSGPARADKIGQVAHELSAIEEARRRVATLGASEPVFRPVLDVRVRTEDGAVELEQKRLLVESERDRVLKGIDHADADGNVLAARILVKRRLVSELESATRTAGSDLALLRRETANATEGLHDLVGQHDVSLRQKAELVAALAQLDQRLEELRGALRSVGAPKGGNR